MTSFSSTSKPSPLFLFVIRSENRPNLNPNQTTIRLCNNRRIPSPTLKLYNKNNFLGSCYATVGTTAATTANSENRLQRLVSEFESLTEPIDRVKRLLDYAARLPAIDEAVIRLPGNRVTGCTTQVWLEARLDEKGRMRFRGDSDSEITKGFISCLIWLLDGLEPHEVVAVKAEDLAAMNVGIHGKAQSRVNTWNNVLTSMQNRTKALVAECKATAVAKSQLAVAKFTSYTPLGTPFASI